MDPVAIVQRLSSFSPELLKSDGATRKEALGLSRMLASTLQNPIAEATQMLVAPFAPIVVRVGIDLGLFHNVANSNQPLSTDNLAEQANADTDLVYRIARFLGGIGYLHEASPGHWEATPLTHAMSNPAIVAGHRYVFDALTVAGVKIPKYLRERSFKAPEHHADGIVQYAHQTKLPAFDFIAASPHLLGDFNVFMGSTMGGRKYWTDWYPISERVVEGAKADTTLLVDVGGGKGHDLQLFLDRFPGTTGLVLQDLPQAIQDANEEILDHTVQRMEYNFFEEQPIKGARAYFLHHIIHDWSDSEASKILARVHAAMRPGYSKLLIHDFILPDSRPSVMQCTYDMVMMTFNAGKERSRAQWSALLRNVGFGDIKFWVDEEDADGLIEAEVLVSP